MTAQPIESFVGAVRAALQDQAQPGDMRALASKAVDLLSEDLVYEAAVTHLTRLARVEWNRSLAGNATGPSAEVVNLRGEDIALAATDEADRAWLAAQRENLARGLLRRAATLRASSGVGPVLRRYTQREVLDAERRASHLVNLADAVQALVGRRHEVEAEVARRVEVQQELIRRAKGWAILYAKLVERLAPGLAEEGALTETKRAIRRVAS